MSTAKEEAISPAEQLRAWFVGRVPDGWFADAPDVRLDREEITVVGHLEDPGTEPDTAEANPRQRLPWRRAAGHGRR